MQLPSVAAIGAIILAFASAHAQPAPTEPQLALTEPPPAPTPTTALEAAPTGAPAPSGDDTAAPYAFNRKTQDTATLGVIAWF